MLVPVIRQVIENDREKNHVESREKKKVCFFVFFSQLIDGVDIEAL